MDAQFLQNRIAELEQQLAACRAAVLTLKSTPGITTDSRFKLLFANSRDIILFVDRSDGRLLDANAAAIGAYGYTYDELLSLTIHDLRAGSTRHLTDEQMAHADAEGILFETIHRRKDGTTFPVEVSSQGATIDQRRTLVSVIRDISERKIVENALQIALKEAEEGRLMLEAILANLPAGLIVTGGPPDFPISRISRYGAEMVHFLEADMIGLSASRNLDEWRLFLPDGISKPAPEQFPLYRAAILGEVVNHFEMVLDIPEGKKTPIAITAAPVRNTEGRIVACISIWSDISHMKQTEEMLKRHNEALRLSESKFQSIFQNASFAMSLSKLNGGPFVEVNDAWCRLMEYEKDEVIGKTPASLAAGGILEGSEKIRKAFNQNGYLRGYELEIRSKSGSQLVLLCNIEIVTIQDQPYLLNTIENITERKQAEKALNRYARELERSNHELQEFAFVASHDLQEPLRKIEAFSDMLLEESAGLTERQNDLLKRLQNSAARMRSMVVGLLYLSRVSTEAQPFQKVDLNSVAIEVLSDLDRRIQFSGASVETGDLPVIEADPLQMHQLLQNLIGNALKFQPPGAKPQIKVYALQPDDYSVKIVVQDNGIGFDAGRADQLFQPFRRLVSRRDYEGSGMGLAICRKIVERHGGQIKVNSSPGQGSAFTVTLPMRQINLDRYSGYSKW